jgi:hypothetical protein
MWKWLMALVLVGLVAELAFIRFMDFRRRAP